jgi:dsRNA-specific ribonuclease
MYKNLLQEFAQCEGLSMPIYKTTKAGPFDHMPTFTSTVEIKGKIFEGKEGKTKKQAELKAAKVAYYVLKHSKSLVLLYRYLSIYLSMHVILIFL